MQRTEPNIAQCSLCTDFYNIPRMLPCQHTFCEHCITNYIQQQAAKVKKKKVSHFSCPQCNERTKLEPNQDVNFDGNQFPINLTIQALLETEPVMEKLRKLAKKNKKTDQQQEVTKDNERTGLLLEGGWGLFGHYFKNSKRDLEWKDEKAWIILLYIY